MQCPWHFRMLRTFLALRWMHKGNQMSSFPYGMCVYCKTKVDGSFVCTPCAAHQKEAIKRSKLSVHTILFICDRCHIRGILSCIQSGPWVCNECDKEMDAVKWNLCLNTNIHTVRVAVLPKSRAPQWFAASAIILSKIAHISAVTDVLPIQNWDLLEPHKASTIGFVLIV